MNGVGIDTEYTRPLSNRQRLPLKVKKMYRRAIVTLFFGRGPAAVVGAIIAVTVNAVNRVLFRRRLPHVSDKVLDRFDPALADLNTFCAVVRAGAITALNHAAPDTINVSEFTVGAMAMCPAMTDEDFNAQASATLCFATTQLRGDCFRDIATGAFTPPFGYAPSVATRETKNGQAAKNAACKIFSASGRWIRKNFNAIFGVRHLIKANSFNYLARAVGCLRTLRPALIIAQ